MSAKWLTHKVALVLAAMSLGVVSVSAPATEMAGQSAVAVQPAVSLQPGVHRLAGQDRYATAAAVSAFAYPGGAPGVVLASGANYPDAVSAAPFAAKLGHPLLLTRPDSLPAATFDEIRRLNAEHVTIVGGVGAVSAGIAAQLESAGLRVDRIWGQNRYETSARVAERGWGSGSTQAFIATGAGFADALAAAPAASKIDAPVLLVPNRSGAELNPIRQVLRTLGVSTLHVAGGTGVVSDVVVSALRDGARLAKRYAGPNRYATAAAILEAHFQGSVPGLFWASGANYPDALAGAAVAGATGSALALSYQACVPTTIGAVTSQLAPSTTIALGGVAVLSDQVKAGLSCFTAAPRPSITGTAKVGLVLGTSIGTWSPAPASVTYQWRRNGSNISGATDSSYRVSAADLGAQLTVVVTASRASFVTTAVTSAPSRVVFSDASIGVPDSTMVVVNKKRPLSPTSYVPSGLRVPSGIPNYGGQMLRDDAATALERMHDDARRAGISFTVRSGYRSFATQRSIYNSYVARDGRALADTYSARPGYSEHQTGLAVDLNDNSGCTLQGCFGQTRAGQWLRENAYRYGYILRYDQGMQHIVGYTYEPWHFRYVGVTLATDMRATGMRTLEQYFGLPAAPSY